MKNNFDLNLLIYLDALLDEPTISQAAKRLHISQPALSNALNRLRVAFDDEILVRSPSGMTKTPFADQIRLPTKLLLEKFDKEIMIKKSFVPEKDTFQFTLAFYGYEEAVLLPTLWQEIAHYPHLSITNRTPHRSHMVDLLRMMHVHFSTISIDNDHSDYRTRRLLTDHFVCCAHEDFAPAALSADDFFSAHHLVVSPNGEMSLVDKLLEKPRKTQIRVSEFSSIPQMLCADKRLITSVPSNLAHAWQQYFPLRIIPFPLPMPPLKIFLTWHKTTESIPALVWFKKKIIDAAQQFCHENDGALAPQIE